MVQLKKIVLQAGDLPAGWKGTPATSDDSSDSELFKCLGAKNTDTDQVAKADSMDYNLGDATISSSASSYKSQSDLDSDIALLTNAKLQTCFTKLVKTQLAANLPKGATLGPVSVKFTPGPGTGPKNVAGTGAVSLSLSMNGQQVPLFVDFAYLTGPLIEAEVDAENVGTPVPAAVFQAAIKAVADRAANS